MTDLLGHLKLSLRAQGFPVETLTMRDTFNDEPEETRTDRRASIFGSANFKREFVAPHFDWRFEDGRRFHAKVSPRIIRTERQTVFSSTVTHTEDGLTMLGDLAKLVKESYPHPTHPFPKG